jgi:hypothetical protein
MSLTKKILRMTAAPVVVVGLALPAVVNCGAEDLIDAAGGCPELASADFGASLDLDADVKVFMEAAGRFRALGEVMVGDVGTACVNIATAGGGDPAKWAGKEGKDKVDAACAEASATITAVLDANASASLEILVTGGECTASLDAAASCNAKCDVSGSCMGTVTAECEPGKLAGECTGECTGSCSVESGSVDCAGGCSAVCNGTCSGTCSATSGNGMCAGKCEGTCTGSCEGNCEVVGPGADCNGTCEGSCSVELTAPECHGEVTASCDVDADCEASCNASVQAQATCTPPEVVINVDGGASAELTALVDALVVELPKLILTFQVRGEAAVDAAAALGTAGANLTARVTELGGKAVVCVAAAAEASVKASVDVNVSVQASASVSGSASGGTN